jgi:arylsulfatase A-like enzyme
LIVRYPSLIKPGRVNSSLVSHIDVAPTLLALAGAAVPDDIQGKSLKPILESRVEKVHDSFYYHLYMHTPGIPEMVGVRTDRYKLIGYPGMKEAYQWELFDLSKDSGEMRNLYNHPDHQELQSRMKAELRAAIKGYGDPVVLPGL